MSNDYTPKVFISYSWSSESHKNKVLNLAKRLIENGVDVIFDQWDLKDGQDKFAFMEQCVSDSKVDKIIIVCDETYCSKADDRAGGVGTETEIITPELYGKTSQTRVIPVVFEMDQEGKPYLPKYLKSRIFIDLSDNESWEDSFDKLLRDIFNEPLLKKPLLGKKPNFKEDAMSMSINRITELVKKIDKTCDVNKDKAKALSKEFLQEYIKVLNAHKSQADIITGEIVYERIIVLRPIRDVYIKYLIMEARNQLLTGDELAQNIETVYNDTVFVDNNSSNGEEMEYLQFIIWEIIIGTVAILYYFERYCAIYCFAGHTFFVRNVLFKNSKLDYDTIKIFRKYFKLLDVDYQTEHNTKFISFAANLAIGREFLPYITQDTISFADMLLCKLTTIFFDKNGVYDIWFPMTYIYNHSAENIWKTLVSKKVCSKFYPLFGVNNISELKQCLQEHRISNDMHHVYAIESCPDILSFIDVNAIGTMN